MSGWLKRLRRRLRKQKPSLLLASIFFLVAILIGGGLWYSTQYTAEDLNVQSEEFLDREVALTISDHEIKVILQTSYELGPMTVEELTYNADEVEGVKEEFANWELVLEESNQMIYHQKVEDLSPVLLERGFFGITSDGTLTLFEGDPQDEKIIHTFFQLNIEHIESGLPREQVEMLRNGIRFASLAEFNSILSTYGEFAIIK